MAKGHDIHQARLTALQLLGKDLARRAKSKCELTGASGVPLRPYEVPPVPADPDFDRTLLLSEACHAALERPSTLAGRGWQVLAVAVWSENPAVQVVAWRMLKHLSVQEDWAREVLEEAYLDPDVRIWAEQAAI